MTNTNTISLMHIISNFRWILINLGLIAIANSTLLTHNILLVFR